MSDIASKDETSTQVADKEEPDLFITVYGGKKDEVDQSFKEHTEIPDAHSYQTWISVSVLRRFARLFSGSVESAGGAGDLVLVIAVTILIIAFFFLWQFVVFFIVILVLALFSGGVAFRFIKGTFIEIMAADLDSRKFDEFVKKQMLKGYFIDLRATRAFDTQPYTKRALESTKIFKWGIYFSLIVATLFVGLEILIYLLTHFWQTQIWFLAVFGFGFLIGILIMDIGVYLRRSAAKSLATNLD